MNNNSQPMHPLILAALAMPKTHRVTTGFADGATREHDVRNLAAAENYATGERRKIGRDLINPATGQTVKVVAVNVTKI